MVLILFDKTLSVTQTMWDFPPIWLSASHNPWSNLFGLWGVARGYSCRGCVLSYHATSCFVLIIPLSYQKCESGSLRKTVSENNIAVCFSSDIITKSSRKSGPLNRFLSQFVLSFYWADLNNFCKYQQMTISMSPFYSD